MATAFRLVIAALILMVVKTETFDKFKLNSNLKELKHFPASVISEHDNDSDEDVMFNTTRSDLTNDYRTLYRLRFNPQRLVGKISENPTKLEYFYPRYETLDESKTSITHRNGFKAENSDFIYNQNPDIPRPPDSYLNLSTNEIFLSDVYPTESHIMKPASDRVQKTISLISSKVKNLFGSDQNVANPKAKGLLNIFEIIKFQNVPCSGSRKPLRQMNGTCYHKFECESFGGIPVGVCADGYGVCCAFNYGCGGITRQVVSYFENSRFPMPSMEPIACTLTVHLLQYVRQVRVDLVFLELKQPVRGDCVDDQFIISGHSTNFQVPVLCGINSGQHMYIDVQNSIEGKIFLSVFGRSDAPRAFSIKITQLRSDFAPNGCLQYHTALDGYISSFNYADVGFVTRVTTPTYLNNMNYAICIRRVPYSCNITYGNQLDTVEFPFQLINVGYNGNLLVAAGQAGIDVFSCADDFIVVGGQRLCGYKFNDGLAVQDLRLNAQVTDMLGGPIIVYVKTNENTVGRGFKLLYNQNACN